jgi:hypothetical protein
MIYGNSHSQNIVKQLIQPSHPFRLIALEGPAHLGKFTFIENELRSVLADEDILIVDTSIDGVRDAVSFAVTAPVLSPYRVILVDKAHELSDSAKDAYLKLCEEPPDNCRICLITEDSGLLPSSLRSRIQHNIYWHLLSPEEMKLFAESVDDIDPKAIALCSGRPGLYDILANNSDLLGLDDAVRAVFINKDLLFASVPISIKELKSGASLEREAVALIVERVSRDFISDSSKKSLVCGLLNFSANLIKYPSINAELHWQRSLLSPPL